MSHEEDYSIEATTGGWWAEAVTADDARAAASACLAETNADTVRVTFRGRWVADGHRIPAGIHWTVTQGCTVF